MKVFISADIEGIATTMQWEECRPTDPSYPPFAQEMTSEVLAAVSGAFEGGATEIVIKDAHGGANNINPLLIPENVSLERGWTGHPYCMAEGVDSSFDAAMFIGYHSAASRNGNPLSHTISGRPLWIKINGRITSEFLMYSWACALEGVPTVLLSGDKMLCEDYKDLHPSLLTVPTKDGLGALVRAYSPITVSRNIRETAANALRQDLSKAKITLPPYFNVEVQFKEHSHAVKVSYFPDVKLVDNTKIVFERDSYLEVLRTLRWIL
ncbi:amino acid amidase [Clostridia bacterium]|nr:amino acid amidase [Clostridia bacterium]